MAAVKMICRVCGKEYTACRNVRKLPGVFRWQEMCCSPECGDIYLARVIASREPVVEKTAKRTKKAKAAPELVEEINDSGNTETESVTE